MNEENKLRGNVYSANDTLDINELAALNDDISPEFIEQLQSKVAQNASEFIGKPVDAENDDSQLFEEVNEEKKTNTEPTAVNITENIDDNYIKKYNIIVYNILLFFKLKI